MVNLLSLGLSLGVFCLSISAHATLGGDIATVQRDARTLNAVTATISVKATVRQGQKAFAFSAPGVHIREYASGNGSIYAISWNGYRNPDLKVLLGSHYAEYVQTRDKQVFRGHGPRLFKMEKMIVELSGHMRAFTGKAYLPAAVPRGLRPGDL